MKNSGFILISLVIITSCNKENSSNISDVEYNFLTGHVLTQKSGWIDNLYVLKEIDKIQFDTGGNYRIIFKNSGIFYCMRNDTFKMDTIDGKFSYDRSKKEITFIGKDSILVGPACIPQLPEGGTFYFLKPIWILKKLQGDTLKINSVPDTLSNSSGLHIWNGVNGNYYFEPAK